MNITEFAEQIVFGTTLEEKLRAPGRLTYDPAPKRPPRVDSLFAPSRPQGLEMQTETAAAVKPPRDQELERERQRGQLLHFLANHELLATELMALVLLKFPEAPREFRQGVLVTLQEEQEHTRMYLRRMRECGVELGRYPLSGQFWRVVEPMKSPVDFVSRLSLTFEQANLDYSQHFARVFQQIGDHETASILNQIYEDEIGHVQHGLHWFRQWKSPKLSDWDAYQDALEFPMSPQRGRGPGVAFNREGRKRAGLDEDFIDAMEVFRQSRGRAATLRWFDPNSEQELSLAAEKLDASLMQQLGKDLELSLIATAKPDDILLVRRMPTRGFRKRLIDAGFELPEFDPIDSLAKLKDRKLHDFSPWAWTPLNHQLVEPLKPHVRHRPLPWNVSHAELFGKSWAVSRLKQWLTSDVDSDASYDWLPNPEICGATIHHPDQVESELHRIGQLGFPSALFKQEFATSGRGQRSFETSGQDHSQESSLIGESDLRWLRYRHHVPTDPDAQPPPLGVVEPKLDRLMDLSYLWKVEPHSGEPIFLGWTRPRVTAGRRYLGTRLRNPFNDCTSAVKQFLLANRCARLKQVGRWLETHLIPELNAQGWLGYFGVDAMVYRNSRAQLKIKPIVELNPRMTMGHVALALERRIAPGVEAEFGVLTRKQWDQVSGQSAMSSPMEMGSHGLRSGVVLFTEIDAQTKLIPSLWVGDSVALVQQLSANEPCGAQ